MKVILMRESTILNISLITYAYYLVMYIYSKGFMVTYIFNKIFIANLLCIIIV